MSRSTRDLTVLLGAVAFLVLLFLVWALFLRKRPQPTAGWNFQSQSQVRGEDSSSRRRRRRRPHRPRNPTLAETGGLPPARPDREIETTL
jgi:hypothetical protein